MGNDQRAADTFHRGIRLLAGASVSAYAAYWMFAWALRHGFGLASSGPSLRVSIEPSEGFLFLGAAAAIVGSQLAAYSPWRRGEDGSAEATQGKYLQAAAEVLGMFCGMSALAVLADPAGRSLLGVTYVALSCGLAGLAVMLACWIERALDGTASGGKQLKRHERDLRGEQSLLVRLSGVDLGSVVRAWMGCTATPMVFDAAARAAGWMHGSPVSDFAQTLATAGLVVGYGLIMCALVRVARRNRWHGVVRIECGVVVAVVGLIVVQLYRIAASYGIAVMAFMAALIAALALPALPVWRSALHPAPAGTATLVDVYMRWYVARRLAYIRRRRRVARGRGRGG